MEKTYKSKISYPLLLFVFGVFFIPFFVGEKNNIFGYKTLLILLFLVLCFGYVSYTFFNTKYTIKGDFLYIKSGFFKYKPINIKTITKLQKTSNIISSPAMSFDRIEIKYGKFDEIIISPKDKVGFAKDLTTINPNIMNYIIED